MSRQPPGPFATRVTPTRGWKAVTAPKDAIAQLRRIAAARAAGQPVPVMFAGGSRSGKLAAAEAIAGDLAADVLHVDLRALDSKYIGETEKNLDRLFADAAATGAILFFDEADPLFGKRSNVKDSHDRYANVDVASLVQRIETYSGIAILATNRRENIDQAFMRRRKFVVDFEAE